MTLLRYVKHFYCHVSCRKNENLVRSPAQRLQAKEEISKNSIFRPGELLVVFPFLHAMGKYTACSGIDQVLVEAEIYGPATLANF